MKKVLWIFATLSPLLLFYEQRSVQPKFEKIYQPIQEGIAYFYEKIGSAALLPYEDVQAMFQWGYKKLTGKPIPHDETMHVRSAFIRTGIPSMLILSILGRILYRGIKKHIVEKKKGAISKGEKKSSSLEEVPVPNTCY